MGVSELYKGIINLRKLRKSRIITKRFGLIYKITSRSFSIFANNISKLKIITIKKWINYSKK